MQLHRLVERGKWQFLLSIGKVNIPPCGGPGRWCHFVLLSSVVSSAQGKDSRGTCTKQGAEGHGGDLVLTKLAA